MSKLTTDYTQIAYFDVDWVSKNVLGFSDEEIAQKYLY